MEIYRKPMDNIFYGRMIILMFKTFLDKSEEHYLDLSALLNYYPEQVLYYYYNSYIKLSLTVYVEMTNLAKKERDLETPLFAWLELFDQHLEITTDILGLANSKFLHTIGPYYYPCTNSRFYFTKASPSAEVITAADINRFLELDASLPISREVLSYSKTRRDAKKQRNMDDMIKDISMCIVSLTEIDKLEKQIIYLTKCLEQRYQIVEQEDFYPQEPDNLPEKPEKMSVLTKENNNLVSFILPSIWKKKYNDTLEHFSHDTKVYLIRYREFEKSLERYKKVLSEWNNHKWNLTDKCFEDIAVLESKIKTARAGLVIYNNILNKSIIHADYRNRESLILFKYYLETGRAMEIQECMNLYEEERHWAEVKESQARIENTIYLMRNDEVDTSQLNEQVSNMLKADFRKRKAAKN